MSDYYFDATIKMNNNFMDIDGLNKSLSKINEKEKKMKKEKGIYEKNKLKEEINNYITDLNNFELSVLRFIVEGININSKVKSFTLRKCKEKYEKNINTPQKDFIADDCINFENWKENSPPFSWIISFNFTLKTPWFSRDEKEFSVTDNPIRVCKVTGFPEMQASSWKGHIRAAYKLISKDANMLNLFFGKEGDRDGEGEAGALLFFPVFFDQPTKDKKLIRPDIITPLNKDTRTAKVPIHYPVVAEGSKGRFMIGFNGSKVFMSVLEEKKDSICWLSGMEDLFKSINLLFTKLGFSAKRTSGYGIAEDIDFINSYYKSIDGCGLNEDKNNDGKEQNGFDLLKTVMKEIGNKMNEEYNGFNITGK